MKDKIFLLSAFIAAYLAAGYVEMVMK